MVLARGRCLVIEGPQGCLLFVRERLERAGLRETYRTIVSMVLSALVVINEVPSGVLVKLAMRFQVRICERVVPLRCPRSLDPERSNV